MLVHAMGQVRFYFGLLRRVKRHLREHRPDIVVLVDSPAWNFHVARTARRLGIPVLYYIAPQLWAWGEWRTAKLRRRVDRVACILPFEQEWFRSRDIDATYVGHPLFDDQPGTVAVQALESDNVAARLSPPATDPNPVQASATSNLAEPTAPPASSSSAPPVDLSATTHKAPTASFGDHPTIALLPGSRRHELERLWQPMQEIARHIKDRYPDARFTTTASDEGNAAFQRDNADDTLAIDVTRAPIRDLCNKADLTLVASGTATLEVAAEHCPMVIMYYVAPWQWNLVGRWLIKTKYLSLVNILAGQELVPEFMPFNGDTGPIVERVTAMLSNHAERQGLSQRLAQLIDPITQPGASARVAGMIRDMLTTAESAVD